jgi:hypothetical protein
MDVAELCAKKLQMPMITNIIWAQQVVVDPTHHHKILR